MKKAKIMLMAIAVLAVVSGALAAKTRVTRPWFTVGNPGICDKAVDIKYTTMAPTTIISYTTVKNAPAPCEGHARVDI